MYAICKSHSRTICTLILAITALLIIGFGIYRADAQNEDAIYKINITGLRTLTKEFVLNKIRSREGRYFYPSVVKADIKDLYATGYFSMINFETEQTPRGVIINIILEEKPILTEITFVGLSKLKEKDLKKVIKSTVGEPADEGRIKQDMLAIKELYTAKGFPQAEVDYQLQVVPEKHEATLKMVIDEGTRLKVKKISYEGNTAFDDKTLAKLMKTKKESIWPLNIIFKTGIMDEEVFAEDLDRIENFYHFKGYLDAKIVDIKRNISPEKKKIEVTIVIEEGPTYPVGEVTINGNTVFPTRSIELLLISRPGTLYSPEKLATDQQAIRDFYFNRGYIQIDIDTKVTFNPDKSAMDLAFSLEEGSMFYVNKINIQGNFKTKDKVIRRELLAFPGEVFHGDKLKTSQERLKNTGFFEDVQVKIENSDVPDHKDVVIDLKEKKTGALSFGAGFSSIDSFVGFAEISQSNFDLFNFKNFQGAGQKFRIRFEGGDKRQNFLLSFVEPYLFDRKLSFGFDAFVDKNDYLSGDYDEDRLGVSFSLGRQLGTFNRGDVILTFEEVDVNVEEDASPELLKEDEEYNQVSVAFKLTRDTRNRIIFPSKGAKTVALMKLSGGTENYVRFDLQRSHYITPFSRFPDHIVMFRGGIGVAGGMTGGEVPLFDRMFLGGSNTVRGFEFREIGPQDINNEPLGGKLSVWHSVEYMFPIITRVFGALFIDAGNVYEEASDLGDREFNVGMGLGVRLNLPIGPMRFDYGFPIVTDDFTDDDAEPQFHFSMGTSF